MSIVKLLWLMQSLYCDKLKTTFTPAFVVALK